MLEVLFTHDSKVEDLFCGAPSEPSLIFSNYFFSLGFKPIQVALFKGIPLLFGDMPGLVSAL